ncbi:linear/branched/unsaturated fatty acid:CoA ligase LbuL [Streptomyces violaceoruber]|uniref:Linear/branched/unsaturated fatty acid:CoA ligase LbuL n=2 Tax=Streptomyces violaceoruber group TaxID=2867121 RepID=A0ACD4WHK9_STRVN|nr:MULTISPECIES: linear/branched/unsaturated fatty acid:CoA ligase LbuL [Streptomyces]WOY97264.1 linear/branched/unsaturated fatty acid:CoA ligase LbuL [Streptomyces violaceoruber]BDD75734.1 AMP-binding protein [Streptomyces coelicolor]MBQ0949943.1 linear/branched/unsaturated fatty acid:CoA ligase LbuL [Streptomyces sp. RK76]MCZ4637566.1 linear/branched/unsaturated fatty acid:CoA ligase LbuL [Streptomyces rubrogriseus]MDX3322113.1 linear/branched/unsaturated fatty acid:CoA ligase LbuL [Strepto
MTAPAPQPSYAHGTSTTPLLGDTVGANLGRAIAAHPDREALVDVPSGRRWTYAEFGAAVDELARGLLAKGVTRGDRVGIWAVNCPEWVLVQYATARIGVIMVNVNPAYRAHELEYVLQQSGISLLVASLAHKSSDYRAIVEQVRGRCPALRETVYIGDPSWDALTAGAAAVEQDRVDALAAELSCDDPVNIQYTSGTTGFPKGATLSHHNILNNGYWVGRTVGYTEQDRVCLPVPFYHCFGMVMGNLGATSHGACIVIPAPSSEPAATLEAVQRERCTSLYGVPTMFIAELNLPDFASYDLTSLRTGIMAGSPCPVEVMKRVVAEMHMEQVSICYGMTETSPVSLQTRMDDDLEHRTGTVGRVLPHIEVKVVDPVTGVTLPRGEAGELRTRGYSVMLGYWEEPGKTAEAIDPGRWMHTGDLAVMREDGYVEIVGRIKDMIIRGGENIYPREVEEFLYAHPKIADVQVVGVPHERYGEEVLACVVVRDAADPLTLEELRAYCAGQLAHYKVPSRLQLLDSFPMTVSGKVRKVELRERYGTRP